MLIYEKNIINKNYLGVIFFWYFIKIHFILSVDVVYMGWFIFIYNDFFLSHKIQYFLNILTFFYKLPTNLAEIYVLLMSSFILYQYIVTPKKFSGHTRHCNFMNSVLYISDEKITN